MLSAHGSEGPPFEAALPLFAVALVGIAYVLLVRRAGRVSRSRVAAGGAALLILGLAISPPLDAWAHRSLVGHMVQHLLIASVAAALLAVAGPVSLVLRALHPVQRLAAARLLQTRVARIVGHPAFGWAFYLVVLWGTHLSPLYQRALENSVLHALEHGLFLAAGYLLWVHVAGADPLPRRLSLPARAGYLVAALPPQSFLGVVIFSSGDVLYRHYGTGVEALADQQAGALVMWLGGDALFLAGLIVVLALWVRSDQVTARQIRSG